MAIFCNHDWELVDKTVFPNELEEMKRLGYKIKSFRGSAILDRKVVWWWKCKLCHRLKKEVEES